MILIITSIDDKDHVSNIIRWIKENNSIKIEILYWERFYIDYKFEINNNGSSIIITNKNYAYRVLYQ